MGDIGEPIRHIEELPGEEPLTVPEFDPEETPVPEEQPVPATHGSKTLGLSVEPLVRTTA
jgi:hypothetical protein